MERREVTASTAHHDAEGGYPSPTLRGALSPELALIDPQLAAAARALLPERRVVLSPRDREIRRQAHAWPVRARDLAAAAVGLLAGVAVTVVVLSAQSITGTSAEIAAVASPVTLEAGAPVTIRWPPNRGASYFDFVLWRDGRRVLDAWPTMPNTVVPTTWSSRGRRYQLTPGRYAWFAYPGIGRRSDARYGALTASGHFTVRGPQ